jgi:predicted RNA-binding Zn ribbon-like protein
VFIVPDKDAREEFRFGLGHVALEFLATLASRRGDPYERLGRPDDLGRWLEHAGLAVGVRCDEALLREARTLREAIYRSVEAARSGRSPAAADLEIVNAWAREPRLAPQVDARLALTWSGADPGRAALARLASAAVELLAGPELARVRNCASTTCSLLYIDRSRPGRRRWCSMERCGNRAKTSRYRQARRERR